MDKYEFNIKVDQIKKRVSEGNYEVAMKIADAIDWRRVRNTNLLSMIAMIYEKNEDYEEAKEILLLAFERAPIGKRLLYKLAELALREGNVSEAEAYYREFSELAPDDPRQQLLRYLILKAKGAPAQQLIHSLESYVNAELDEKWLYELAELYSLAGMPDRCIEECDRIMLMFGLGKYVDKAMELKLSYAPLTKYQMDLVENRDKYEAKLRAVEQEYSLGGSRVRVLEREPEEEYEEEDEYQTPPMEYEPEAFDAELAVTFQEEQVREKLAREMDRISGGFVQEGTYDDYENTGHNSAGYNSAGYDKSGYETDTYGNAGVSTYDTGSYDTHNNGTGNDETDNYQDDDYADDNYEDDNYKGTGFNDENYEGGEFEEDHYEEGSGENDVVDYRSGHYDTDEDLAKPYESDLISESQPTRVLDDIRRVGRGTAAVTGLAGAAASAAVSTTGAAAHEAGRAAKAGSMASASAVIRPRAVVSIKAPVETISPEPVIEEDADTYEEQAALFGEGLYDEDEFPEKEPSVQDEAEETEEETFEIENLEDEEEGLPAGSHLMVESRSPEKGLEMAVEALKQIHRETGVKNAVAKITGSKLSKRGVLVSKEKLLGKDLIIEEAGDMSEHALTELNELMEKDESGMIVVLIDNPKQLETLHRDHPVLARKFECIGTQEPFNYTEPKKEPAMNTHSQMETAAAVPYARAPYPAASIKQKPAGKMSYQGSPYEEGTYEKDSYEKNSYEENSYEEGSYEDEPYDEGAYDESVYDEGSSDEDDYVEEKSVEKEKRGIFGKRKKPVYEVLTSEEYDEPEEDNEYYEEERPSVREEGGPGYNGEEMDIDEFAQYASKYANEIDCSITGKSMLALYERIEILEEDGILLTRENAEGLIEEAADRAEKPSFGKRIKGLFSSKYDKDGLLILKEEHFIY